MDLINKHLKMNKIINHLVFDMNNVIEDYTSYQNTIDQKAEKILLQIFSDISIEQIRKNILHVKENLFDVFGDMPFENHYIFWEAVISKLTKKPCDHRQLVKAYTGFLNFYLSQVKIFSDVRNCFILLHNKYILSILANGNSIRIRALLDKNKLNKYINNITASGDFYFRKPEQSIYDYSIKRSNSSWLKTVMIGDRIDNDIIGANKTGIWSILLDRDHSYVKSETPFAQPDVVISNLTEIKNTWVLKLKNQLKTAVILAGGRGSRMGAVTQDKQKCLLPYNGKPIIKEIIDALLNANIEKIIIIGNYRVEELTSYIQENYSNTCKVMPVEADDTASALLKVINELDEEFVFCHGNLLFTRADLHALIKKYYRIKFATNSSTSCLAYIDNKYNITHSRIRIREDEKVEIIYSNHLTDDSLLTKQNECSISLGLGIISKKNIITKNYRKGDMIEALLKKHSVLGKVTGYKLQDKWLHLENENDYRNLKAGHLYA